LVASDPRNLDFSEYAVPDPAGPADSADPAVTTSIQYLLIRSSKL
jgi:hypothetical protein